MAGVLREASQKCVVPLVTQNSVSPPCFDEAAHSSPFAVPLRQHLLLLSGGCGEVLEEGVMRPDPQASPASGALCLSTKESQEVHPCFPLPLCFQHVLSKTRDLCRDPSVSLLPLFKLDYCHRLPSSCFFPKPFVILPRGKFHSLGLSPHLESQRFVRVAGGSFC